MSFLVYVKRPSELCLFLSRSRLSLGLVSVLSRLGLGDNFLFGLVSVSSRWGKISLVSSRSRLGQKIFRYFFSVSVSCYNSQDKISRSRSRTKIEPLVLLGLGLVQEIRSRPTLLWHYFNILIHDITMFSFLFLDNILSTDFLHILTPISLLPWISSKLGLSFVLV